MEDLKKIQRSKIMQAVKSKGSKIEVALARGVWAKGHKYRKNDKKVFGTPDLTMKRFQLAIFVDSEFWHGKNWEVRKLDIKSNHDFWFKKIERNIQRDKEVNKYLKSKGWKVLRFWGKEVTTNLTNCINKIDQTINKIKKTNGIKE